MMYIIISLEVILSLMLTCAATEYSVFDELGVQFGSVQHNLEVLRKSAKRESDNSNIVIKEDEHTYYSSQVVDNSNVWIEINPSLASTDIDKSTIHEGLSSQFRYAYNIQLPFVFPYYGLPLRIITPTTGGFIFVGELIHNQLTETQYIAPLMAEFNPSLSDDSAVYYQLTSTRAIVQWDNVVLHADQDKGTDELKSRGFTFQAQLFINGDIIFAYKKMPYLPSQIDNSTHYVKIGIAEAYYQATVESGITVTFVHEFHTIKIDFNNVSAGTGVVLKAETSCLSAMSCHACGTIETNFNCSWCPKLQQCSDGFSRWRQEWKVNSCLESAVVDVSKCPAASEESLPSKHTSGAYEMQVCQNSKMALVCASDDTVMIEEATFSRENYHGSMCEGSRKSLDSGDECSYDESVVKDILAKECNSKSACFIQATKEYFGADPCPGYEKTLFIYYRCHGTTTAGKQIITAVIVIIVLGLFISFGAWFFYAYRNPTSPSGLWLIKYGRFWRSTAYKSDNTEESGI